MVAEECRRLLDELRDDTLRQIALMRMEGYTNDEIAERLDCGLRSITRKIELIRRTWLGEDRPHERRAFAGPRRRLPLEDADQLDQICDRFEAAWRGGAAEDRGFPGGGPRAIRGEVLRELIAAELEHRARLGEQPSAGDYLERFPDHSTTIVDELGRAGHGAGDRRGPTLDGRGDAPPPASERPRSGTPRRPGLRGARGAGAGRDGRRLQGPSDPAQPRRRPEDDPGRRPRQPGGRPRFLNEAEVVARLRHPNIVQIYGSGDHEGRPYIELEYVDGGSLAARLDGTPWPSLRAAGLVEVLARAVHAAHRQGVVHRDLKPANVLLDGGRASPRSPTSDSRSS